MGISTAFAFATITNQMNQVNEAVNGAFKPLISYSCEMPPRMDAEEAFKRCSTIATWASALEELSKTGMGHLASVREGQVSLEQELPAEGYALLDDLMKASRAAKLHVIEMFDVAEKSESWKAHLPMLRPLKRKYVKALTAMENIAIQFSIEFRQAKLVPSDLVKVNMPLGDVQEVISSSHKMLGASSPKWI